MNNKYTVVDLFAGVGGLSKAFQKAGAEIVYANEIDRQACSLYRENFSDICLDEGDLRGIQAGNIPNFDILAAGFPCLTFSMGMKKKGFDDEGESLFYEFLRIVEAKKPRAFLLESDRLLMSHNQGMTFQIIIEQLEQQGYLLKNEVFNSLHYGNIPHNKERVYIVGFRDTIEFEMYKSPGKTQLNLQVKDVIDIGDKKEEKYYYYESSKNYLRVNKEVKIKGRIHQLKFTSRAQYTSDNKIIKDYDFCPALTSYIFRKDYVPIIKDDYGVRRLTEDECFMMQGFFDFKIPKGFNGNILYKYAARCSSVEVVRRIAENIIKTFDCSIKKIKLNNLFDNNIDEKFINIQQQDIANNKEEVVLIKMDSDENKKEKSVPIVEKLVKSEWFENKIKQEQPINNENEYTLKKVIPALKNTGFFDVKYNHGNDEYGKDVTYKYKDNFETIKCGAVQVKYGNISGGAKGDIDLILAQIEDAFDMPFVDIKECRNLYINQLLIICSGNYTKNAKAKILEKLKTKCDVRFFDGQDIDEFLEKNV